MTPKPKVKAETEQGEHLSRPGALVPTPPPPEGRSIADEQRERSLEIERAGVETWKTERDERSEEDRKPRQVEGLR